MARLLEREGEKVSALIMLMADGYNYRYRLLDGIAGLVSRLSGENEAARQRRFLSWRDRHDFLTGATRHYAGTVRRLFSKPMPEVVSRVWRKARRIVGRIAANRVALAPMPETPSALVSDAIGNASASYLPAAYGGKVTLLWPEEEPPFSGRDAAYGWSQVCSHVQVVPVPGAHHSCVAEVENVRRIGDVMRDTLDAADPQNSTPSEIALPV
jgi:hypothetical protein